jgi:uncharacterized protein YdeI (YjbR/CyaY-like superfamily)
LAYFNDVAAVHTLLAPHRTLSRGRRNEVTLSLGDELRVADRPEWRNWLQEHHDRHLGVWLVFYKLRTGKTSISYDDAVEEALCWGWVDSQIRRIDSEKFARRFTPRRPGSKWSPSNVERAKEMIVEGRMMEAGLVQVRDAQMRGTWAAPQSRPRNLQVPSFLSSAIASDPKAEANFRQMAGSHRDQFVAWVAAARTEATRRRRVLETLDKLRKNEKLGLK